MFSENLIKSLSKYHLLTHPFYQAWIKGELTLSQLQNYAVQYYPHVNAFPQYVSAIHSLCEDAPTRKALAHNLADEEGVLQGESHPELWLSFGQGLGLTKESMQEALPRPSAQQVVRTFFDFARSSYSEGLGALFAYEHQIPPIAESKIKGLREFYGIESKETLKFFEVHQTADVYHSQACAQALDRLSPSEQTTAQNAALTASQALWDFLSDAYESA